MKVNAWNLRELKATAYREAGQAVAALHKGLPLQSVTIIPTDDALGHVKFRRYEKWFDPEKRSHDCRTRFRAECDIVCDLAGQIAEKRFRPRSVKKSDRQHDNQNIVNVATRFCGSQKTKEAYLHYCWCAAEDVVDARWSEIVRVASALLSRNTLKRKDVLEVMMFPGVAALRASLHAGQERKAATGIESAPS
jgi:hypothetical protein